MPWHGVRRTAGAADTRGRYTLSDRRIPSHDVCRTLTHLREKNQTDWIFPPWTSYTATTSNLAFSTPAIRL